MTPPRVELRGRTPDLTPAQLAAIAGAVLVPLLARLGFDVSTAELATIAQAAAIVAGVLIAGDAHIRHGRATGGVFDTPPALTSSKLLPGTPPASSSGPDVVAAPATSSPAAAVTTQHRKR